MCLSNMPKSFQGFNRTANEFINIGVAEERGSIKVGKYADLVVLDENFEVVMTIAEGNVIYKR